MTPEQKKAYNKAYYESHKQPKAVVPEYLQQDKKETRHVANREYYNANKVALKKKRDANKEAIKARNHAYYLKKKGRA